MTDQPLFQKVAEDLSFSPDQVKAVEALLAEGATVPFIARYRKEATNGLDEVAIMAVRDRLKQLAELAERKAAILKSLEERGLLSDELKAAVEGAETMAKLEDLYLPFRPKRRTKAMVARERGLAPLAELVWAQDPATDPAAEAAAFVDPEKEVPDAEAALAGARHIIAEQVNEDAAIREVMRALFEKESVLESKVARGKEEDGVNYRDYFDHNEPAIKAPSHRILAMRRGEKEGVLNLKWAPDKETAIALLKRKLIKNDSPAAAQVDAALIDCYNRLLGPAMETEARLAGKKRADEEAVKVFAENVRQLLLAAPLGRKRVLALDPGYRTGCKVVCLNEQGDLLHHDLINIMTDRQREQAGEKIRKMAEEYQIQAIAVGNGTASRETESLIKSLSLKAPVVVVSESGASVYSASEVARAEFPDLDLTVRGAVSIGRRLMDPLAELVKIDPKAIGVGQYQHDVDQGELKQALGDVVVSAVNAVGVEVNTASKELLSHVSGLGPALAGNIVSFREENGPFKSREQLLKVPRLGPKAFEQAAGFLRVAGGDNPLDASAVHPESYPVVQAMAHDLDCLVQDLMAKAELRAKLDPKRYINDKVGLPTITDILAELAKPGRDPRDPFEIFSYTEGVETIEDLKPGLRLNGVVTNITNFGAFVDIGVHRDGLVHVSHLADRFVKDPKEVVSVHQKVQVVVTEVDQARGRISLSMKSDPFAEPGAERAPQERGGQRPDKDRGGRKPAGKFSGKKAKPGGGHSEKPQAPAKPKEAFNNPFAAALAQLQDKE